MDRPSTFLWYPPKTSSKHQVNCCTCLKRNQCRTQVQSYFDCFLFEFQGILLRCVPLTYLSTLYTTCMLFNCQILHFLSHQILDEHFQYMISSSKKVPDSTFDLSASFSKSEPIVSCSISFSSIPLQKISIIQIAPLRTPTFVDSPHFIISLTPKDFPVNSPYLGFDELTPGSNRNNLAERV